MLTKGLLWEFVAVRGELERLLQLLLHERVRERLRKEISEFWIWVSK